MFVGSASQKYEWSKFYCPLIRAFVVPAYLPKLAYVLHTVLINILIVVLFHATLSTF